MYQIIIGRNKGSLAYQTIQKVADPYFQISVFLESVREEFRQKYATSKKNLSYGKAQQVHLLNTPSPKTGYLSNLGKTVVFVANTVLNKSNTTHVLRMQTRELTTRLLIGHLTVTTRPSVTGSLFQKGAYPEKES
jgi:hypothetical protein